MTDFFSQFSPEVMDAIGVAGFGIYVMNYSLLTLDKLRSQQVAYFVLNWMAASMVLIGLMSSFNLAAALIQVFFICISTLGIILRLRIRFRQPPKTHQLTTPFHTKRAA